MKKLVEREKLQEFSKMLDDLSMNWTKGNITIKLMELQLFYDMHILEKSKEGVNEIKRQLYKNMKNAPDEKTRQEWYNLYQTVKEAGNEVPEDEESPG